MGITHSRPAKPLIAAVEACDLVVAARDATFGVPEAKRGRAAAGGLIRPARLIPQRIAMEMALIGDPVGVEFLHAYGLINRVTEPGDALAEATRLAQRVIANAPLSVAASKRVVLEQRGWSTEGSFRPFPDC